MAFHRRTTKKKTDGFMQQKLPIVVAVTFALLYWHSLQTHINDISTTLLRPTTQQNINLDSSTSSSGGISDYHLKNDHIDHADSKELDSEEEEDDYYEQEEDADDYYEQEEDVDDYYLEEDVDDHYLEEKEEGNGSQQGSPYAYAYLIAGCDPSNNPEYPAYLGYIYNIAIGLELLKQEFNSTADVIVMVRMHKDTNHTKLPPQHEAIMTRLGAIIKYIPKPNKVDNFRSAILDKFRILELTEYDRVFFFDSDVMPLNNLDYMFHKSVGPNATLEENVVIGYSTEPANAGSFMLAPHKNDYEEISKIIERINEPGFEFDVKTGFGHSFEEPDDYWLSHFNKRIYLWDFHNANSDQGLLYHWTKYEKKKVSAICRDKIQSWREDKESGKVRLYHEDKTDNIFADVRRYGTMNGWWYLHFGDRFPYKDFNHFFLEAKPWLHPPVLDRAKHPNGDWRLIHSYWYEMLRKVNDKYSFGIDVDNLMEDLKPPPHGFGKGMLELQKIKEQKQKTGSSSK